MALNNIGLGLIVDARDMASANLSRVERRFGSLDATTATGAPRIASGLKLITGGLLAMGIGAGILSTLVGNVEAFSRFGEAIAEATTLLDGTEEETRRLTEQTLRLSGAFGADARETARAFYQTISAGVGDIGDATELLTVANKLAVGGVTDVTVAVDALTTITNAYGRSIADATDISDTFFVAIKAGKTTAGELGATIGRVAPVAASLGIQFDELAGAIAAITTGGIVTSEAVTGLKAALANVLKPTADARKEAQRLGIEMGPEAIRRIGGFEALLRQISTSSKFTSESFSKLFGSIEGLNVILALTAGGGAKFQGILEQMELRAGATEAAFRRMEQTLAFQQRRLEALRESVSITIGAALAPLVGVLVDVGRAVMEAFLAIPAPIRDALVQFAAAASAALIVLGAVVALKGAMLLLGVSIGGIVAAMGAVAAAALPVVLAIGGLIAVVAALATAVQLDIGGIGTFFHETFGRVRLAVRALVQLFTEGAISGAVKEELQRAQNQGVFVFVEAIAGAMQEAGRAFSGFVTGMRDGLAAALPFIEPAFGTLREALIELRTAFGEVIDTVLRALGITTQGAAQFQELGAVVGALAGAITTAATVLVAAISRIIAANVKLIGGFVEGISLVIGGIIRLFTEPAAGAEQILAGLGAIVAGTIDAMLGLFGVGLEDVQGVFETMRDTIFGIVSSIGDLIKSPITTVLGWLKSLAAPIVDTFNSVVDGIKGAIDRAISFAGGIVSRIPFARDIPGIGSLVAAGEAAAARIAAGEAGAARRAGVAAPAIAGPGPPPAAAAVAMIAAPAGAPAEAGAVEAAVRQAVETAQQAGRPIQVRLEVDGEVLAEVVAREQEAGATRAFAPMPALAGM